MGSLWNRSGTIERYADDLKADGALAYFFQGGTTTPLTVFADAGESSARTHPVMADAFGRWPDVFVPYTLGYDVKVTTADGVQLTYTLNIPNPDPVDLIVTPDVEADVVTGMIHAELANTTKAGYVRLNGRTVGNGSSGGTERANADVSDLFTYMWNNLTDAIAPVSGGRGGSAAADFAANKTITLPDCRGAVLIGLDDMGNSAGSYFTGLTFHTGNATTAGSRIGINGVTITTSNMPAHSHSGTTATEGAHTHTFSTTSDAGGDHNHGAVTGSNGDHTHTFTGTQQTWSTNQTDIADSNTAGGGGLQIGSGVATLTSMTATVTVTPAGTNSTTGAHTHTISSSGTHTHGVSGTTAAGSAHSHAFTTDTQGSGTAFNNLPRSFLVTWYIKL